LVVVAARQAINFTILALVALGFSALPGGNATLNVLLTLLGIVFFAAIALLGYRLYREHRFTLDSLGDRERLVLYASVALAFLTFVASKRLFNASGGLGVLVFLALLALASYGVFWVFQRSRRYD
jgi:ABC-type transport system involved in cytochrome c biogenesis permease subunit